MKRIIVSIFIFFLPLCINAQKTKVDSLKVRLSIQKNDTNKIAILNILSRSYFPSNKDSAILFSKEAVDLSEKLHWNRGLANSYALLGEIYSSVSNNAGALECYFKAKESNEELKNRGGIAENLRGIGFIYLLLGELPTGINYYQQSLKTYEDLKDSNGIANMCQNIAYAYNAPDQASNSRVYLMRALNIYEKKKDTLRIAGTLEDIGNNYGIAGQFQKALEFQQNALGLFKLTNNVERTAVLYENMGEFVFLKAEQYYKALYYFNKSLKLSEKLDNKNDIAFTLEMMGDTYLLISEDTTQIITTTKKKNTIKKAQEYYQRAIRIRDNLRDLSYLQSLYSSLATTNKRLNNYKEALKLYEKSVTLKDSLANEQKIRDVTNKEIKYEFEKQQQLAQIGQVKKDATAKRIKNQQYFTIISLGVVVLAVIIIASIQFRNNKHKQKANVLLHQQKLKVDVALNELKNTQSQLIQSEKMASLGELTAGIAHEIQNPLNFVNNFSEVNKELLAEMNEEIEKGNYDEVKAIAKDVIGNEEKINHHGKRADAIVKGMLQHSRSSSGVKEPTDINALGDEYLRLSYHGLRAKDKDFNAEMKTDFDNTIDKINIISQDIGRVLLNLYNNAFYAVTEKKKQQPNGYEPTIYVTTKKLNNKITITVKDNGNGIPQKVIDKIFQPFFTTKPTGEGTGLGLSLSYDIIKAHGGEIKVNTTEGEFTEFVIQFPIST